MKQPRRVGSLLEPDRQLRTPRISAGISPGKEGQWARVRPRLISLRPEVARGTGQPRLARVTYWIDMEWTSMTQQNGIPLGHPRPHNSTHTRAFQANVEQRLNSVVETMQSAGYGHKATRSALRRELRAIGQEVASQGK
jgi:hypothetical protein